VTPARRMKWKDYRFHFFDRNPQIFSAFEVSLEELQAMVFDFSEQKKYNLTRHALGELRSLVSAYLVARDDSLRVPTSTMAMIFPSETGFDPVLTRQLERFKAQAARGISNSDQEFVKQVVSVLADLSLSSLNSRSYFAERGENSVTVFVAAYLNGSIQDAAVRRLDDVALEGADHLTDLCKALIDKKLYMSALTQLRNLEQLATVSVLNRNDVVLSVAVRSLSDCLLHNCIYGQPGNHVTRHLLESLFRITNARLASPLGLDNMKVSFSIGPFVSPTERSSFTAINVAMANGIINLSQSKQHEAVGRLRYLYEELHDRAWLDFAELGIEAVRRNSFLLYYVNSTIEETVRASFQLLNALDLPPIEEVDMEAAREQRLRDRFRDEIRRIIRRETTGIYSRIIPAMFEHRQINYLDGAIKTQCLFGLLALRVGTEDIAMEAVERIFKACVRLQDPQFGDIYASSRLAIQIAQIGIYAIASKAEQIFRTAAERYTALRRSFRERFPDLHFVGDFESAERELLEEEYSRSLMIDPHEIEFFSAVTPGQIRAFFAAVE
jgi:hypothetical protein